MDAPSNASHPTQAMAARQDCISRTSGTRGKSRRCVHGGGKLPPSVAEQWTGAECGSRYKLGRSTGNPETLLTSTSRTAGCGPACPVVWQGRRGDSPPYADLFARVHRLLCLARYSNHRTTKISFQRAAELKSLRQSIAARLSAIHNLRVGEAGFVFCGLLNPGADR